MRSGDACAVYPRLHVPFIPRPPPPPPGNHHGTHADVQHRPSPVDVDCVLLAYSMGPGHGLQVVLWVPVAVKYDHGVGGGKIDAQTSGSSRQQESKVSGARRIEVLHCLQGGDNLEGTMMVAEGGSGGGRGVTWARGPGGKEVLRFGAGGWGDEGMREPHEHGGDKALWLFAE